MLSRVLEPELMDTAEDASEYDTMDHAAVNTQFVTGLLTALKLHVGLVASATSGARARPRRRHRANPHRAGPPRTQCSHHRHRRGRKYARDRAQNVAAVNLSHCIGLALADGKQLPFESGSFPIVISNSIIHHIADPQAVLAEAMRVTTGGGFLFHRDLARPTDEAQLQHLVETYAGNASPYQRKLFADSLGAALTFGEIRELVAGFGYSRDTVQLTSDRHWTWLTTKK